MSYRFPAGCIGMYGVHRKYCWLRVFSGQRGFVVPEFPSQLTILQWLDYFCSFIDSDLSWRIPLFIQCIIGAILAAGSLVIPESPR
jgi:hypothetical protein